MKQAGPDLARRSAEILDLISRLKSEHPFWGYRRVWANLKFRFGIKINKKRVYRLMREHGLTVKRHQLKARRTPQCSKPRPAEPNQWWGIDMSKVMTDSGWVYIVIVLDWYSKKIVGWKAGYQSKTVDWLDALDLAVNAQFPQGVRGQGLNLMRDNGCQPTSVNFMKQCATMGINQAFTSYNNPKGNADTERMFRTVKEELLWLNQWTGLDHIHQALGAWIKGYNHDYLHSALNWKTPIQAENYYYKTQADSLLNAA